jgi:hypothetical protein
MAATVTILKALQEDAGQLCLPCLREHIADNAVLLGDLIEITHTMAGRREVSAEDEDLYQEAFAKLMAAVFLIATFTGELTRRPAPLPVPASLN